MTKGLQDPFDVVAEALGCQRAALSMESAMYRDYSWDSFGHVAVICALEQAYGVSIDDQTVEKYASMKAIFQLYEELKADRGQPP